MLRHRAWIMPLCKRSGIGPEVAQSVETVNAAVYSLRSTKTGNYPVFSGVANGQETISNGSLTNGWQLALNLQWTPFDFGQVGGQITEAQGQLVLSKSSSTRSGSRSARMRQRPGSI